MITLPEALVGLEESYICNILHNRELERFYTFRNKVFDFRGRTEGFHNFLKKLPIHSVMAFTISPFNIALPPLHFLFRE